MPRPRIFISYARKSRASLDGLPALESALAGAGFDYLRDVKIQLGETWEAKLQEWLTGCHGAVVLLSPEALSSEWVAREVAILTRRREAEGSVRMRLVPVAVGGISWDDLCATSLAPQFAPLSAIQGATGLDPAQLLDALRGLHDFVGLPVGLDRGRTNAPATALNVLRASQETVPFGHREQEMAALHEWVDHGPARSILLVHGPGGVGKTRLAVELMRRQNEAGWDAGFLKESADGISELLRGTAPLLVTIDYAETRVDQTRDLLRAVATHRESDVRSKVRVLLLARNRGDWWSHLTTGDATVEQLADQSRSPLSLMPFAPNVRPTSWTEAVKSFAVALARPVPVGELQTGGSDPDFLGLPLYLHLAALDRVLAGSGAAVFRTGGEILDRILSHESRYWRDWLTARGHAFHEGVREVLDRSVAAIALSGGARTPERIQEVVEGPQGRFEWRRECWDLLRHLYPDGRAGVRPLEPDLLAEHAVDRTLHRTEGELLASLLDGGGPSPVTATACLTLLTRSALRTKDSRWLMQALDGRLGRLSEQAITVASSQGEPLGTVLRRTFDADPDEALAKQLSELLPPPGRTWVLRELAVSVARRMRERASLDGSADSKRMRANAAAELAMRLAEVGDVKEALSESWEGQVLLGELMQAGGEAYAPALAGLMGVHADLLAQKGDFEAAIQSGRSVILLLGLLKPEHQQGIGPILAARYNNLANSLAATGRHAEAAEAAKYAVDHYRHQMLEGRFTGDGAVAMGNLGRHLVRAGDVISGANFLRVATGILRKLAERDPEGFEARLANNLDFLATTLRDRGETGEALDLLREAVDVLRAARRRDGDALAVELGAALTDLGVLVASTSEERAAVAFGSEATAVLGRAVEVGVTAARPELARAFHNLSGWLSASGARQEAFAAIEQAIAIRTNLLAEGGLTPEPLALSQGQLGKIYLDGGDAKHAMKAFETGLETLLNAASPEHDSRSVLERLTVSYTAASEAGGGRAKRRLIQRAERALNGSRRRFARSGVKRRAR